MYVFSMFARLTGEEKKKNCNFELCTWCLSVSVLQFNGLALQTVVAKFFKYKTCQNQSLIICFC